MASVEWGLVQIIIITTGFLRSVHVAERNIRRVGCVDHLRRISPSRCSLSIRRAAGAAHPRVHHLQRNETQSQGWTETRSPNNQKCAPRSNSQTTQSTWK